MKNLLVTGGAGFIGCHFIRYYLAKYPDKNIINLDKLTYAGSLANLSDISSQQYHFIQGDIADAKLLESIFDEFNIDNVIHFAAESHVDRSITGPDDFIQTNIIGTFHLLQTARRKWSGKKNNPACA